MAEAEVDSGGVTGRSIVVTGGGSGIGAACAARLVADGALVTICGRTASKLEDVEQRLVPVAGKSGGRIQSVASDVTVEADVERVLTAADAAFGGVHGVVANAGGGGAIVPFHLQEADEFLRVLHLNVLGTFLFVKHAVPRMVTAGGGSFVGMSSIAGHVTHPHFGAYTVSKAGIEAMMRNAADEYGEVNVRFNAVRPGFVATELMAPIPRDSDVYDSYIRNTPMQDVAQPEDVADVVRFLLGTESRWVTGQAIGVDGGHSLRAGPDFSSFIEPVFGHDALVAKPSSPPSS